MAHMHINFAQPLWLWGLLLIPAGWLWHLLWQKMRSASLSTLSKFIDKELIPHVLLSNTSKVQRSYTGLLYSGLIFFIIIALANPRWSFKDIEAFQPTASMVIMLDLSASMNATDVAPSRIVRARQYIEDLLNMSRGLKIGMVGFAGYPHLINPITDDIQTIKTYVPALDTDLTSKQGNSLHAAMRMAADLLKSEPGDKKSVLLLSDGNFVSDDFSREMNAFTDQNIQVHVVGVGTLTGAPYKNSTGVMHKAQGKLVTSKMNDVVLKDIARQGHGIYTEATHSEVGLRTILSKAEQREQEHIVAGKVRQWDDSYYFFLLPAAMILLYLMRSRVLYVLMIGILSSIVVAPPANASTVKNLFLNSAQRGQQYYMDANFNQAAQTFSDPYQQGVALYRDGQYEQAEAAFKQQQRPSVRLDAIYNAGNAQMQQSKWQAAIDSYEAVLKVDPDHFPAQHNLEIAKKMLEQQPEQENKDDCDCKNKDKNKESDKSDSKEGKDQDKSKDEQNKEDQQSKQDKQSEKENQSEKKKQDLAQQQQNQEHKQEQENSQQQDQEQKNQQQHAAAQNELRPLDPEEEQRIEQWLNRVDSDIKVFLKNKFYVEDMLGAQ